MTFARFAAALLAAALVPQPASGPVTVILQQPMLTGIAGNFFVPRAQHSYPSTQPFNLILWQTNPFRPDGELVPSTWRAGDRTGFFPSVPLARHQASFRDAPDSTTVQIDGDTVGVFLNSADLPTGSDVLDKMMITPADKLAPAHQLRPFAEPGRAIVYSLDLQIPTAVDTNKPGNFTYAVEDMVFEDAAGHAKITYEVALFHHTVTPVPAIGAPRLKATEVGAFDAPSQTFQVGNPLSPNSRLNTPLPGTTLYQTQPWLGWKPFHFAVTRSNFAQGLASLAAAGKGFKGSTDPAAWTLTSLHLNAELTFKTAPAQLGWSMRRERVTLEPEANLHLAPLP